MEDRMFLLQIRLENDAFYDEPQRELCRILREIAHRLETRIDDPRTLSHFKSVFDINGNPCGQYAIKPSDYIQKVK